MAVEATELLGQTSDGKQIRLAQCAADSLLLREIGRLRELTFRQVGEGTGRSRDLDAFDPHYQHIVVWDAAAMRIAGAYRVARSEEHTSERPSLMRISYAVFFLKKQITHILHPQSLVLMMLA